MSNEGTTLFLKAAPREHFRLLRYFVLRDTEHSPDISLMKYPGQLAGATGGGFYGVHYCGSEISSFQHP